jgi:cyclic beta-1,2-glucan synthetase
VSPQGERSDPGIPPGATSAEARSLGREHSSHPGVTGQRWAVSSKLEALTSRLEAVDEGLRSPDRQPRASTATEWLLDNRHLILEHLLQLEEGLPRGFVSRLSVLPDSQGGPTLRVEAFAAFLVDRGDGHVDLTRTRSLLRAYQTECPLTMAELWAFPLLLRFVVLSELARDGEALLTARVGNSVQWASEAAELVERISGAVRTLKAIGQEDWKRFFEAVSRVEGRLRRGDPGGIYRTMDFETRDRYRKVVEEVAASCGASEEEVAQAALELSLPASDPSPEQAHVGHALFGAGRRTLERSLGCRVPVRSRLRRLARRIAFPLYATAIVLLAIVLLGVLAVLPLGWTGSGSLLLALALSLVPALTAAMAAVNWLVPLFVRPWVLPKLDLSRGITARWKTAVAVPCLLTQTDEVGQLLRQLELNFLGNRDDHLSFVLLSDFGDADEPEVEGEEQLLDHARAGIRELNARYGGGPESGPFLLLHRGRSWNASQECWMGWERKRGKLVQFNGLLLEGDTSPFPHQEGDLSRLDGARFVLTLDADTFLPQDGARRLVGTLAHPLNRARFDGSGRVVRGYTVLQPRVEVLPPDGPPTFFSQMFQVDQGLDLYSQAVSDVYQDLLGEGIFAGKGLYDVASFERSLEGRVPDNALLSHDLFEGVHGRAGVVSDVVVFEDFPHDSRTYFRRLHRWIRGDWQLLPWLLPRVPGRREARLPNRIPWRGRWKILDNLRRSLLFPSLLGLLLAGWFALPGSPNAWTLIVLAVLALPILLGSGIAFRLRAGVSRRWAPMRHGSGIPLSGTVRGVMAVAFLPHRARLELDAIIRTLYRLFVSHRDLLEWTTAAHAARQARLGQGMLQHWRRMPEAPSSALVAGGLFVGLQGGIPLSAIPILVAWAAAPALAHWTGSPRTAREPEAPTAEEALLLRRVARRTWAFFEDFVGPEDHWLPPDHFQESPRGTPEHRTSPTNVGLTLVSAISAYDLGYLTLPRLVASLSNTLDGMDALEVYQGHLFNWYDTRQLSVLEPRYVSTVDSGNLLACLIVVAETCDELTRAPLLRPTEIQGVLDTLAELESVLREIPPESFPEEARTLERLFDLRETLTAVAGHPVRAASVVGEEVLQGFLPAMEEALARLVGSEGASTDPAHLSVIRGWVLRLQHQAMGLTQVVEDFAPWLPLLTDPPPPLQDLDPVFSELESVDGLAEGTEEARRALKGIRGRHGGDDVTQDWADKVEQALGTLDGIETLLAEVSIVQRRARRWVDEMDFTFLYDDRRRLFHIGYDASAAALDGSYYDLLASEARIASFVACGQGQVPARHWLQLGRPFGRASGGAALLSWAGTMFEYLMPPLFLRTPRGSLLDVACRTAIQRQIEFAEKRHVPWGVSESSFHQLDGRETYQYRAFGVPELAIRRDVAERIVITPYASFLALPFKPRQVRRNLENLLSLGMLGPFGLYEAVDFGRSGPRGGDRPRVVRSFMAHHQGMILAAIANRLAGDRLVERFHRDPRMDAASYLLHERAAGHVRLELLLPHTPERPSDDGRAPDVERWSVSPETARPSFHVLSNGSLSVVLTARGGGGTRWQDRAVTRWVGQPGPDEWGSWIYVRDLDRRGIWSVTSAPVDGPAEEEDVFFAPHAAEFRRRVGEITSRLEVFVASDSDVEVRRVTLVNHGSRTRRLELTSALELSLAPVAEDRRHPAFQKLFVEVEHLPDAGFLHARRRRASPAESPMHLLHGLGAVSPRVRWNGWESRRERFLGRCGSPALPEALARRNEGRGSSPDQRPEEGAPPDAGVHPPLDPLLSVSASVTLRAGERAEVSFVTCVAASRDECMEAMRRFETREAERWAEERARGRWKDWLHAMELPPGELRLANRMLSGIIRPFHPLRGEEAARESTEPEVKRQGALWGLGVSGDDPVVVFVVTDPEGDGELKRLLQFHALWRRLGVRIDLILIDETAEGYHHPVRDAVVGLMDALGISEFLHARAGIHYVPAGRLDGTHREAIEAAARLRLDGARGTLERQMRALDQDAVRLPPFVPVPGRLQGRPRGPDPLPPSPPLMFDNGLGGFTQDGREYIIRLSDETATPAPWINVIATPEMGFIVSERGSGFTWAGNSAEHRLTAWANDPVLDGSGEALYLRDEETARVWSPMPGPVAPRGEFRVHHGAGCTRFVHRREGLHQEVELFATFEPSAKVIELRVENLEDRPRRLTATFFADWVLGGHREVEAPHLVSRFHPGSEVLTVRNRFARAAGPPVAFLASDRPLHGWTADREEFLGDGGLSGPAALARIGLAQRAGAMLDPCGAVQVHLSLEAHEHGSVRFLLGAASDEDEARGTIEALRPDSACRRARRQVERFWDGLLGTTTVSTPDPGVDLLLNRWARYQAVSCRLWGRSALYQSAGAFGFRDQLQDVLCLLGDAPSIAREHILEAARHQFVEGDVLHWWHPPEARGVRTRCSDDLLWLPFAVASYVRATGDLEILRQGVPFLDGPELGSGEMERYGTFTPTGGPVSLHEHCLRALRHGFTRGPHGLPLIGLSDWNDGLDRLGRDGKGESAWLGWFYGATARGYAEVCELLGDGDGDVARELRANADALQGAMEGFAWDGSWYLRATHDDGTALGRRGDPEGELDSLPQSWAVLSGEAASERAQSAMEAVLEKLVREDAGGVLLLAPPFDRDPRWPGYIRAYPPGVRENGGQYTHAGTWVGWALAALGRGEEAMHVFRLLSPVHRTLDRSAVELYRREPYAVAGDVAGPPHWPGLGGWSWFTGSAAWLHRLGMEGILGIRPDSGGMRIDPCIPPDWPGFQIERRMGRSTYRIQVENPHGVSRGVDTIELDGAPVEGPVVPMRDDGKTHLVRVVMSSTEARRPSSRILP